MKDWRRIMAGRIIPTENCSDQPHIVKPNDGAWLCVVTTGSGREGESGQRVLTLRSMGQGRTWSAPFDAEPADGPSRKLPTASAPIPPNEGYAQGAAIPSYEFSV